MRVERWLYAIPLRLRSLLRRANVERDLDEELRYHVERQVEANIARGMTPAEARTAALRAFGGIERHKDSARDMRGMQRLENVVRDVQHAVRIVRRGPVFAAVVVLSLALGIGAATAVFNLAWNVLYATLALPRPEQLVSLRRHSKDDRDDRFTWEEFRALRAASADVALTSATDYDHAEIVSGTAREYDHLHIVDGTFFDIVGVRPLAGRLIEPTDDANGANVVVLGERLATRLFPGNSGAVGRTILIRGAPFTVIGVSPASFRGLGYPGRFEAAIANGAAQTARFEDARRSREREFAVVGRIAARRDAARAALTVEFERCCAVAPDGGRERLEVLDIRRGIPGGKDDVRADVSTLLAILLAGMGLVLVVVCCNIASLLIVRAAARRREIAVRLSLGASVPRLVAQLVTEIVPLALAGGAAGVCLAVLATAVFVRTMPPAWLDYADIVRFRGEPAVVGFAVAITVACALSCSVWPALRAIRQPLGDALRSGPRTSRTSRQGAVARGVVVAQVAVTVVLVTASSLLALTLRNLDQVDAGFTTERVLLAAVETRGTAYELGGIVPLHAEILRRVREVPGVRSAAMATVVPMFGGRNASYAFDVPGHAQADGKRPRAPLDAVTPGYFAAAGIPLVAGRDFTPADHLGAEHVVIVSSALARRYFPGGDPVGRSMRVGHDSLETVRVVGVAADARYFDLRAPAGPMLYAPVAQAGSWPFLELVIRTDGAPLVAAAAVRRAVDAAAPGVQVRRVTDMVAEREAVTGLERLAARLAMFVSVVALVLAAIGLYGVVAHSVAGRTSELAIRVALGARRRVILWLVLRESLEFVGLGVLVGVPLSFAANGAIASQLFGVGPHDPVLAAGSIGVLTAVAILASVVPASRAVRIEPARALAAD